MPAGAAGLLARETGADPFLHVGFQHAEGLLVPLNRQLQSVQHPLGRKEIRDNPLRNGDRLRGNAKRLRIETKVDNQFFGRTSNAAKVGVERQRLRVVNLDLRTLLGLACNLGGIKLDFWFLGHRKLLVLKTVKGETIA